MVDTQGRKVYSLLEGWRFTKDSVKEPKALSALQAQPVVLPHTWNAVDGQDGGNDYYRGTCWYIRQLSAEELAPSETGGRVYIEFDGAAMSCDLYIDEEKILTHAGGYSRFRADLTRFADGAPHMLYAAVSNEDNQTVYPQKADFTFYGGIYRSVRLIKVPAVHFALGYMGTSGLRITPKVDLEKKTCDVMVTAYVEHKGEETVYATFETAGQSVTIPVEDSYATAEFHLDPAQGRQVPRKDFFGIDSEILKATDFRDFQRHK